VFIRDRLYKNTELRAEIEKLRGAQMGARRVPVAQRASDASLRQRDQTLAEDNKRLRAENTDLKANSPSCSASAVPRDRRRLADRTAHEDSSSSTHSGLRPRRIRLTNVRRGSCR
jgi:hypothetical protein